MRALFAAILAILLSARVGAVTMSECTCVVRVFGDASSWMTSCFVVGDGSWVVTTADAVTEKVGPQASEPVRTAIFISPYTGEARQCEVKAKDPALNIALLKLPASGLPSVQFAKTTDFAKAPYHTLGELMSGEPIQSRWPTQIYGVTRQQIGGTYKLVTRQWSANNGFLADIDKFKWLFVSDVYEEGKVPAGSIVARAEVLVGMYLNTLVITGGARDVAYGRCVLSSEIARFLRKHGVEVQSLYSPPNPTVRPDETAAKAFQLQALVYSLVGSGRAAMAVEQTAELVRLRPKDAQVHSINGVALTAAGKFDEALKAFDQAAELYPTLPMLRLNRALALVGAKKTVEAEAELLKAAEESPGDVRAISALADFYLSDEKTYDKALKYAAKTVELAPHSPAALLLMGRVHQRMKDYQKAIKSIESALQLAPDWPLAHLALGATYEAAQDLVNAEKTYRRLVELQPGNAHAILALATFLADTGKKDEPLELVAKLRELNPPKEILDAAKAIEDKVKGAATNP